jgi:hypothetical protein
MGPEPVDHHGPYPESPDKATDKGEFAEAILGATLGWAGPNDDSLGWAHLDAVLKQVDSGGIQALCEEFRNKDDGQLRMEVCRELLLELGYCTRSEDDSVRRAAVRTILRELGYGKLLEDDTIRRQVVGAVLSHQGYVKNPSGRWEKTRVGPETLDLGASPRPSFKEIEAWLLATEAKKLLAYLEGKLSWEDIIEPPLLTPEEMAADQERVTENTIWFATVFPHLLAEPAALPLVEDLEKHPFPESRAEATYLFLTGQGAAADPDRSAELAAWFTCTFAHLFDGQRLDRLEKSSDAMDKKQATNLRRIREVAFSDGPDLTR